MRAGGPLPKQFQKVGERSLFWRSVEAFLRFDPSMRVVLVVHPEFLARWHELFASEETALGARVTKVAGGPSRVASVRCGLEALGAGPSDLVFIHDSARPLVSPELIARGEACVRGFAEGGVGAVPVVPLADSIRRLTPEGSVSVPRSEYVAVQTPQIFRYGDIAPAYARVADESAFTDDASVAEAAGVRVVTFPGDSLNFKVTTPLDLRIIQWM